MSVASPRIAALAFVAVGLSAPQAQALATYEETLEMACGNSLPCDSDQGLATLSITLDETNPYDLDKWAGSLTFSWTTTDAEPSSWSVGPHTLSADVISDVIAEEVSLVATPDDLTVSLLSDDAVLQIAATITEGEQAGDTLTWVFGAQGGGIAVRLAVVSGVEGDRFLFQDEEMPRTETFGAAAVPLPAALPLAAAGLAALGGLGALSRRRSV